jgi:hypothetical protein
MSKKTIIRKFDKLFSKWVRLSNADAKGYCECITCGRSYKWNDIDAGHFVSRRHLVLRFDPRNVFPQCRRCNRFLNGLQYIMGKRIDELLGVGTADELIQISKQTHKIDKVDLEIKYDEYLELSKKLNKFD